MRKQPLVVGIVSFAMAGAVSRSLLRHTESRWQIAAFCLAACAFELARPDHRPTLRLVRPLALGAAAAVGVIAAKAYLEPGAIHSDARQIRQRGVVGAAKHLG